MSAIVDTVDPIASVQTKVAYGGRLNVASAVSSLEDCPSPSNGIDWPEPPAQPSDPGGDGGEPVGGTGPITPPITDPIGPIGGTSPAPLTFQIIRPSKAKIGRTTKVRFRLKCSAVCSASVTARPIAAGVVFKAFKGRLASGKAGTRTVKLKVPRATLRAARALLADRSKVRLKYSVVVTDKTGQSSKPITFSVKLVK